MSTVVVPKSIRESENVGVPIPGLGPWSFEG